MRAFLARRTGVAAAQRDLDRSTEQLAAGTPGADDAYAKTLDQWLNLGGANLEERATAAPHAGAAVAVLPGAVARRGEFTLGPVDLQIGWADQVAITGANGSGKTTLRLRHTYWVIRVHAG